MKAPQTPEELIKLARSIPPDERVPYAFEKRILARIQQNPAADTVSGWAQALWRGVGPSLALMALALLFSFANGQTGTSVSQSEAAADLETAVYAPIQLALSGETW